MAQRKDFFANPDTPETSLQIGEAQPSMQIADGLTFDYETVDASVRGQVVRAVRIARRSKETMRASLIEMGRQLMSIKEAVPYGQFTAIVQVDIGLGERAAQSLMRVAETFGDDPKSLDLFSDTAQIFALAAPSTPETARERAIEAAKEAQATGAPLTRPAVKAIIDEEREKAGIKTPAQKKAAKSTSKSSGGGGGESEGGDSTTTSTTQTTNTRGYIAATEADATNSENKSEAETDAPKPDPMDPEHALTILRMLEDLLDDYTLYGDQTNAYSLRQAMLPALRYYTAKAKTAKPA